MFSQLYNIHNPFRTGILGAKIQHFLQFSIFSLYFCSKITQPKTDMETFLAEVARALRAEHPDDLDRVTVVFNNRRSGLFLRRHFARMADKPFFLPRIVGFDDLVAELGGLEIVSNEMLLFELFDIHSHMDNPGRKFTTFEEFIAFGDMMLADFSQIDLYGVDARQLFGNLHDLKALGEWDIEEATLTPFQKQYLHFYASLFQYYDLLHRRLLAEGKAYSGMAYRHVAEQIETLAPKLDCRQICFVGFNAFSACESRIIQYFEKQGIGKLYTDGDAYYYDNPDQEAGHFLRRQAERFADIGHYPNHFATGKKIITLVSCPEQVLQCKYAGNLLAELAKNAGEREGAARTDAMEQTALVLGDESLLLPVLNSLPEEVATANITMGYPLADTSAHDLMLKLFALHQRRHGKYFYHQDINDILSDFCIARLLEAPDMHTRLTRLLVKQHFVYADPDELRGLLEALDCNPDTLAYLFPPEAPTPDGLLEMARQLVVDIHRQGVLDRNLKELEALGCLLQTLDYLIGLQEQYHFVDSLSTLQKIYTRLARRRSVAFYGEPLGGLQILGMLETRNLDFRRVVLLSVNEGVMPAGNNDNSLIPYNLKTAFGLPTYHEKDAVYAYNFYRLLQRAEEIYLVYSTNTEGLGKGEPSRFLLQLRHELAQRFPDNITLREVVVEADNHADTRPFRQSVEKDGAVLRRLEEMADYGFSPSALNKYRGCPLKFYYENVLALREVDEVSEDLAQSDLGTCIHAVLQEAFSRDSDRTVRPETLQGVIDDLDGILDRVLEEQFSHGRSRLGRNHFLESVARKQIVAFLRGEIKRLHQGESIEIVSLEQPLGHALDIGGRTVRIIGTADRIDRANGVLRIIDYKSGKVEERDLRVDEPDPDLLEVKDKWFQVVLYAWLQQRSTGNGEPCLSGIQPLGRLDSALLPVVWDGRELLTPEQLGLFEGRLAQMIADLMNPTIPFEANPGCDLCKYCPFHETCHQAQ